MSKTPPANSTSGTSTPGMGVREFGRWIWTQLTSMRTALALLFLLALAAIPGSLVPQTSISAARVRTFRTDHPALDKLYTPLGMYSVYTSPWFSAIYLLLFVSLIGCIIPRIRVYARALRQPPPRIPSRLDRLPENRVAALVGDRQDAVANAEKWLRSKRFRVRTTAEGISAERGYLREFGNLVFHVSMVFMLLGIAWNNLYGFKGTAIIVEGQGFSNNITQYDEYKAGARVDTDALAPFTVKLKKFFVRFETGAVQTGAPRDFTADVDVTADGTTTAGTVRVNHPLTIDGNRVHLLSFGYAPHISVTDGNGDIAFSGPVVFLQQDGNFTSKGVIKVPDARPERLAFDAIFVPTSAGEGMPRSLFPDALNPVLYSNAWAGAPKTETGEPENVFVLDTTGMTQMTSGDDLLRFQLKTGQEYRLPDGKGTIALDGWSHWSRLQVSRSPGLPMAFASLAVGVLGLCLSLFIRPRRLWLRVRDDADGHSRVEVGGLDRADARTGLSDDVDDLLTSTRATTIPEPVEGALQPAATNPTAASPTALTEQETP